MDDEYIVWGHPISPPIRSNFPHLFTTLEGLKFKPPVVKKKGI
jgi:hypothetical protein